MFCSEGVIVSEPKPPVDFICTSLVLIITVPPNVVGLNSGPNSTRLDHTWTIVGAVVGFAAGIFLGIVVAAFFFRKSNIFLHAKRERQRRRRRIDLEERGNERKSKLLYVTIL